MNASQPTIDNVAESSGKPVARLECDRFCGKCQYNLRSQPVLPDPRLGIPVVRCPECGQFEAANQPSPGMTVWVQRLSIFLLIGWLLLVLWVEFMISLGQGAITGAVLDEMTQRRNNGIVVREIAEDWYREMMILAVLGSLISAFAAIALLTVACYHWPRAAYAAVAVIHPIIVGAVVWFIWEQQAPHLLGWGARYMVPLGVVRLVGGIAAVQAGRPFARLLLSILLPPRPRQALAFLWTVDGLSPPRLGTPAA